MSYEFKNDASVLRPIYEKSFGKMLDTGFRFHSPLFENDPNGAHHQWSLNSIFQKVKKNEDINAPAKKILEVGSGPISFFESMFQQFPEIRKKMHVTAIDYVAPMIKFAQDHNNLDDSIQYMEADATKLIERFSPSKFDTILDAHLIHCLTNETERQNYVKSWKSLLSDGGEVYIECGCSHARFDTTRDDYFFLKDDGILLQQMSGHPVAVRWVPTFVQFQKLLLESGLSLLECELKKDWRLVLDHKRDDILDMDPMVARARLENKK